MTGFVHDLCEDARCFTDDSYAVFGWIALRSTLHLQLPFSKQALKGWKSRFPAKSRAGVDLCVWDLVALESTKLGFHETAAAIIIQGDTYLRPCEIMNVARECVVRPRKGVAGGVWGIVISPFKMKVPTKAGEYDDCVLLDTASRHDTNAVLKAVFESGKNEKLLFESLSYKKYCEQIAVASASAGLQDLKLTPHILRHSGASHDAFHEVRDFSAIQERGRWKASKSVLRYKKPGRMLLENSKISQALWLKAKKARAEVVPILTSHFARIYKNFKFQSPFGIWELKSSEILVGLRPQSI